MSSFTIIPSEVIPFDPADPIYRPHKDEFKKYDAQATLENEKLNDSFNMSDPKIDDLLKPDLSDLNDINIEEENKKDFIHTELFAALFNRYYNKAIKLIEMGVKVDYPENNFDETPLGLLLRYIDESPEKETEQINIILEMLIDKNIKINYEKDPYNNYRIFTYLAKLISNEKYHNSFITFIKKYYIKDNILKFSIIKPFININDYNILNVIQKNNITIDYEQKKVKKDQELETKQYIQNNIINYYEMLELLNDIKQDRNKLLQSEKEEQIDENDPNYIYDQSLIYSVISNNLINPKAKFDAYNALLNTGYKLESAKYEELLKETIKFNCLEIFKSLRDKGAEINIETFNLILEKLSPSNGSIVIQKDMFDLIYNLIDTIKLNDKSIELIIQLNDLKLFYFATHKFTDFNNNNFEKFIKAAIKVDNKQIIKELINFGARLEKETATTYIDSYIYQCIKNKNYKLALFLIDNGAKINFNDFNFKDSLLYSVMYSGDLIFYPTVRKINKDTKKDKVVIIPPYDTSDLTEGLPSYDLRGDINIPYKRIISPWSNSSIGLSAKPISQIRMVDEIEINKNLNKTINLDDKVQRKQINNKDLIKLIKLIVEKSDYLSYSFNNIDSFQESPFSIAFRFYSEEVAKHVLYNVIKHHIKIYYNHKYSKHIIDYEIVNFVNKVYDIFNSYISKKEIIDNDINFENIIDDFVVDQKLSEDIKNLLYLEFNNVLSNVDLK